MTPRGRRRRRWNPETDEGRRLVRGEISENLREIAAEAMDAWRRSREPLEIRRELCRRSRSLDGPEAEAALPDSADETELLETRTETRDQNGSAALLAQARGALSDLRKLWGLDARPERSGGGPSDRAHEEPVKLYAGIDPDEV